jgi:hypothetical protein
MGTRRAAVAFVWLVACGGGGSAPDAGTPDAGAPDAVSSVAVTGRVLDWINRQPQAGVTVTVEDHPEIPMVVTGADGRYRVEGVSPGSQVRLRCEKDEYVPLLTRMFSVGETDYETYDGQIFDALASRDAVDLTGTILGEPYDPELGGVVLRLQDADSGDPIADATVAMTTTGHAPLYFNQNDFPDPELTATSASGLAVLHNYEIAAGDVSVDHPTLTECSAVGADAPPLPLTVDVLPDTTTWIPIQCAAPSL